jgi:hypothetical protein
MCGNVWRWRRAAAEDEGWGRACGGGRTKNARGAQENLWPKSSLERPVARHFVWGYISKWLAVCNLLKIQGAFSIGFVGIALGRERFTSAGNEGKKRAECCGKARIPAPSRFC